MRTMRLLLGLLVLSVLFIGLLAVKVRQSPVTSIAQKPTYIPPTSVPYVPDTEDDLFQAVNKWRVQTNRLAYKKSTATCDFASFRAPQLKTDYSHKGFHEHLKNLPDGQFFSENLLENFTLKEVAIKAWLNSPFHRKALEADYTHSCIKCDSGYCVQIFSYF